MTLRTDRDIREMILTDLEKNQSVQPPPYRIEKATWTYNATDVDVWFTTKSWWRRFRLWISGLRGEWECLSAQRQLVVIQPDGFTKVLIPYDEGDGHSAGEALHTLKALNYFDQTYGALAETLRTLESRDDTETTSYVEGDKLIRQIREFGP